MTIKMKKAKTIGSGSKKLTRTGTKTKRNAWTQTKVKELRRMAGKTPAKTIGRRLGFTEGATRQKAGSIGVSLAVKKATTRKAA